MLILGVEAQEIHGLQALEHQMTRNLDALRRRRDTARYAKTVQGRILNFGGRIFAIYCVFRVVSVSVLYYSLRMNVDLFF